MVSKIVLALRNMIHSIHAFKSLTGTLVGAIALEVFEKNTIDPEFLMISTYFSEGEFNIGK